MNVGNFALQLSDISDNESSEACKSCTARLWGNWLILMWDVYVMELHTVDNDCEILGVKIITVLNVILCFIA